jgi:hypothetical protein
MYALPYTAAVSIFIAGAVWVLLDIAKSVSIRALWVIWLTFIVVVVAAFLVVWLSTGSSPSNLLLGTGRVFGLGIQSNPEARIIVPPIKKVRRQRAAWQQVWLVRRHRLH